MWIILGLEDVRKVKYLTERDIDMLLLKEFNTDADFSAWFLTAAFPHSIVARTGDL